MKTNLLLQRLNAGKKASGVLREANETLTRRYREVKSGVTVAQQWLKYVASIFLFFTLSITNAWGADVVSTMDLDAQSPAVTTTTTSFTATQSATWTLSKVCNTQSVSSDGGDKYYQIGSGSATATSMTWTSSSFDGETVKSVAVKCSSNGSATVSVTGTGGTFTASPNTITGGTATTLTFNSSNANGDEITGNLVVNLAFASATRKNIRLFQIVVTYAGGAEPATYTITYDCDGADSGCPSTASGQTALPNPLPSAPVKGGFTFEGWYTNSIKTTAAVAGATLNSDITLYAKWALATCHETTTIFYPIQGNMPSAGSFNYTGVYTADASTNNNSSAGSSLTGQTFTSCNGTQISFTHTSGSSYNTIWYASSTYDIRLYANNPVTFTAPSGYIVKSVSKTVGATTSSIVSDNNTSSYQYTKSGSGGEAVKYFTVVIEETCTELGAVTGTIGLTNDGTDVTASGWTATTGGHETGYLVKLYNSDKTDVVASDNVSSSTFTKTFSNPGAGTYWVSVTPIYSGGDNYCATGTETFSGSSTTITPAAKYTVTLKDDDTELEQASVGAPITLLSRSGCTGYTFAGWTKTWTSHQTSWTTTKPTIIPAGSYTPTANENLYPVYTKTESGGVSTTNIAYSGSTTNMTGNNDAATFGLDASDWSVVGAKGGNNNYPGLNTAGDIRLYYHSDGGNTITITAPTTILSVGLTFTGSDYNNAWVKVGGSTVSLDDGVYPIGATSFVIGNANTSNVQVRISNIAVNFSVSTTSYISVPDCCTPPATALSITSANTVTMGNTLSLTTTGGNGETVTWSVVNGTGSATVSGSTLTPVSVGTVTVTATQPRGATCGAEVTQEITISAAPCTADPTIGDPTIPTSFTLTSLTGAVSVNGSVDEGANCSWADMGLVWGATANPTVSNNKKAIAGEHIKSFANNVQPTGSTTPTAWVVGTTYYVRIYGQNNKAAATYHYSTNAASFTLRSIDFEENGGSTVNMIYCNDGGVATKPTDPTQAGFTFNGWYKESTLENPVDWANDEITENKTYYAKWTPLATYTVTLEDDGTVLTQPAWGTSVNLPERVGCEGSTFVGWTKTWTSDQTEWTTTAPTIEPAGEYTPSGNETLYPVYTKSESEPGSITHSVSISSYATAHSWANDTKYTSVTIDENVTATASGTTNTGKYYTSGTNWRFYQTENPTLTISTSSGTLSSVTITYSVSNTGVLKYGDSQVTSGTAVAVSGTSAVFTVGNSGDASNGQVRITAISVTYTGTVTTTSYISVPECTIFGPGRTIFVQADNGANGSAWNDGACVKAWFNNNGSGGSAQPTYWLFDASAPDAGKKLFATVIPASGDVNQVTLQRFAGGCSTFWNDNGTLTGSSATSNAFRTECSGTSCVAWNATGVILSLKGSPNSWGSSLGTFADQGGGVWMATYNNYTPTGTSDEFKIETNYNGWIGNKVDDQHQNENAALSGMIVGSTYNVTATLDVTDHSLVITKEFVKGTVHFDMQGHGTQIADLTNVTANSKIVAPTAPTATDYLFRGWYKEAACINEWDFDNDEVTETLTLYAKWVSDKFTVTWVVNGETTSTTSNVPNGETTSAPASPSVGSTSGCDGTKVFRGWTATADYEHAMNAPADLFTETSPAITDDITFYAVFALANGTKTYEFEITPAYFNTTSYAANNNEKSSVATATDGTGAQITVKWVSNQVMKAAAMQWQKNTGYIYNTTDLGTVNSVTIPSTGKIGTYHTNYGTFVQPSTNEDTPTANCGYFKTKHSGDAAGATSKVVVNFTAPYYIGYSTTCVAPTKCMTPMFDPGAGTYSSAQNVTILSTTGATIYYTTDGSTPTTSSSVYSTPIAVTADMTIKALAVKDGLTNSDVATAVYHIRCAAPTFSPAPGTYNAPLSVEDGNGDAPGNGVTISCATPGATIYITLDGTTPTTGSIVYEGAIDVNETMVIKAIAVVAGMAPSEVAIGKYIIADCDWYESFASCAGTGGNDGTWSGISATGGIVADHDGWNFNTGGYGGSQCIKVGASKTAGSATTPSITVTSGIQYKLTFNMAPWDNGKAQFEIVSGAELLDGTTSWQSADNMTALDWNKYEVYIRTTATTVQIDFSSTGNRFWLNDVCLKGLGDVKYHVTYEGNGSTGGTVPVDNTEYDNNATVTVKGNTGSLEKAGYSFDGWNTKADGSGTEYAANATFNILHDVTLYAQWKLNTYTIAWKVNGSVWTEGSPATSATYGTQPASIPTAPTSGNCDGSKVFIGWSASSITGTTSTRPKDLFTSKYAAPLITNDVTFHAVFATPTGVPTQFDLYSGALTEGEYLVTYNNKAMKAAVTTNRLNYEEVTVTEDKVSNNEPSLVWYLYQDGGYWRLYNTTAGYAAATNVKNQAVIILDGSDNKAKWTATGSATYEFRNKDRHESTSNPDNKWLRENGTYGFACYNDKTGGALTLYKRNASYSDYATTCTAPVLPYLIAEPTMLDFGNVAVNASVPAQTVTLSGDNLQNTTITVTAPNAGFTVSPTTIAVNGELTATTITVTPITTTAGNFNGNLVITYTDPITPANSITINIPLILTVSPLYTVTLHDLNTDEGTEQTSTLKQTTPGSAVILPTTSPSSVCMINGWVFAGWKENSALSETSVEPTLHLDAYTPTANIDLYAVYMHRSNCTNTTDNITRSTTGAADDDTYVEWDDITVTSGAEYSGSTAGGNGNDAIQFRSTDESGIITTTSVGVVSQVSVTWNAATVKGRVLQIYGKNTAYRTTSELYDPANRGILLGTLTKGTNITTDVLTIDADFKYIGIRSKEDLAYATTISVVWSDPCTRTWDSNPSCNPCTAKPTMNAATVASYATTTATVNCSGITNITGVGGTSDCKITSFGYCWGVSSTPNLTDYYHEMGTSYETLNTPFGAYTITGLTPGVTYCVRPYATNGLGTAYGAAECFTTTLVDHISFEVPNGVDAPQTVTLDVALPIADVPQDCGNCWVFVGWTPKETWDAQVLPDSLYKAGYSASSQGLNKTYKLHAVYKRDFYRMLTYPSELALDDGGAQTAFDDNYYVLTLYTGETTGEWAMDADLNGNYAKTTNIDNILHLEFGNYSIFNPEPKDVWHLENLSKTGTGEGSSATTKIYNLVEGGSKKYIRLASSGAVITTNASDGNLNLSVTSNNEAGLAASFNIYRQSGRYTYYLARTGNNEPYYFTSSTSAPSYSAYVYKRQSLEYKTIPECPKYTVTWKLNGATVRTDYVSRCEGVPKPPTPPVVSPLDECGANGFLGWSMHKVGHLGSEYAPSDVFKDKEDAPELQGDVTFYAIYGYPAGYEYIGDKAVLAHGETYLFLNRKNAGSGKVLNASALTLIGNSSGYTSPGANMTVGADARIDGEYENYEFYCDQRKVNNSNLRVVADATRTKYLHISDKGIGYKVNNPRSHYTTKNLLYGWNESKTSVRYAYCSGSNFTVSSYNKNVYAFRKIYKNFKTTCYEEWPATAVEWGQNKLIIDMDTSATAVAKAAKYDVQIGSLHSSKMDVVQTKTSYQGYDSPRTLTIDGSSKFDFTTNAGDVLIVNWYDASNEKIAFSHIYIPSLVASSTTLTEDKDELHVLPGAMLTVNKPHEIGQLEVYPGATVFITGATLTAEKFILRGGWSRVNEAKYDVGRVDIHPSGSLNKSHAFMDWYLDYDLYYPIAVPFPVATKDIVYKNAKFTPEATLSYIKMKYYDGKQRAETNQSALGENWKDYSPLPTNLEPSKGYAFTAKRPGGRAFSIIRMPMSFTNAWTTNGEKGVVNGSQKNVVEITKYCYGNTIWKAMGWNFVANPYLALYNGNYLTGNLEQQEGGTVRYATIPTIDFQDYYQVDITQADLAPGSGFFVQAGGNDGQTQNIIFASDGRKHMPARILDGTMDDQDAYIRLEHANANDQMGIIVGEDYTEEYEINADLAKMMNPSDNSLKSYLHYNNMDLAYVALSPELAKEWIPVIVRVPESGTYTYTLKESSSVPALEAVWLQDALTGIKTNLLTDDYTFQVIGAGTITGRFSINAIVRPYSIETEIGNLINDDDKYVKFIYQNHIYIRYKGVIYDSTGKIVELPNE